MLCLECGAENREGRRFCAACGAPLAVACGRCGFRNEPGERFCGGCGARLAADAQPGPTPAASVTPAPAAPEGERRQVTVLFADLADYTRLGAELDAEDLHALMGRFFDAVDGIVEGYGGTVDKHIGDCVMATFGAPTAHGNDPERAARAALDIQAAMPGLSAAAGRPLRVHVGIASGQVVASGTGAAGQGAYTVTGESVNLASRLTDAAGPGETLAAEGVYRAVAQLLDGEAVGEIAVKGFDRPVSVWRLRGLRRAAEVPRRPFVGRRAELRQFEGVLEACRATGGGLAVYLRGEAGIGKTRLAEEFRRLAAARDFACHTGLVLDFGVGSGRDAIRTVARGLLGLAADADPEAGRAAVARALEAGLVGPEREVYLNDLLDLPQPPGLRGLYDAMDDATRGRGRHETVAALVRRASARRPLVITVEDVHWADAVTLGYLATVAAATADCPAVLVMTSRIEGDPLDQAWRGAARGAALMTIDLGPLRRQEAMALAGAFLEDAGGRFAEGCVERAEGNPLFLEQLLRNAEEGAAAGGVPGSIQSLVLARMDRLPPGDKRALQAASVLGQRFALDALRHLIDGPSYDCAGLVRHYLVRPEGGDGFLFAHALVKEGVYGSLLNARRRELHRRAAAWYADRDPVLHAEHLERADDPAAPRAYLAAARSLAAAYDNERALPLVRRGVALARERADAHALTCFEGEILHHLGAIPESIAAYERALEVADGDAGRCRALIGLAAGMRITDRYDDAFAALDEAERGATAHGLTGELARVHFMRGNLYFPLGRLDTCREQHELALRYAQRAGSPELEAQALGGLGDAEYARGRMITAHGHFRRCVELCRTHGFGRIEVANLPMAAIARVYGNDPRGALHDALAAVAAAARVGHHRAEIIAHHGVYISSMMMRDGDSGREHAEAALALSRRLGARRFEAESLLFLGEIEHAAGRRAEALRYLREALAVSRDAGMDYMGPCMLGALARATDDPEERRAALAEGEALLAAGSLSHNHLWFRRDAIEACLAVGDWDGAEGHAAALEAHTLAEPLPWAELLIARGRALAAFGRGRRDGATLAELSRLRDEAARAELRIALPALDAALAAAAAE